MRPNQSPLRPPADDAGQGAEAASVSPPKLSVLIPTYNYARYLPEAIESVLEQDYGDFELLIGDDCSTDNSAAVIARYAAQDKRIRFHVHPANLGMVQNWNWCLAAARGKYIKFMFGDDRFASGHALARLVALLESHPTATLAASARYVVGANAEIFGVWNELGRSGLRPGWKVIARCLEASGNLIGEPTAVLFRRRDAARGFRTDYRQLVDQEMWFHLLEKGDLAYTAEPLCCFRRHALQQTEQNKLDRVGERETLRLFTEYHPRPYLRQKGFYKRLFSQVYDLRKRRRRDPHVSEDIRAIERELTAQLGKYWYAVYWMRHRIVVPFANLRRWIRRHRPRAKRSLSPSLTWSR